MASPRVDRIIQTATELIRAVATVASVVSALARYIKQRREQKRRDKQK